MGLDTSWRHAFDVLHSPSLWSIVALGLLLLAIFGVWLAVAHGLYVAHFGENGRPITLAELLRRVLATPEGRSLIWIGNAVGFLFALTAFALSAVSFPLLLDRNVVMAAGPVRGIAETAALGDADARSGLRPCLSIRYRRALRASPSRVAARETFQPVSRNTCAIRCASASAPASGSVGSAGPGRAGDGIWSAFDDTSAVSVRSTARVTTFLSSRMFPGQA